MKMISVQNRNEAFERTFERVWFGFLFAVLTFLLLVGSGSALAYTSIVVFGAIGAFIFYRTRWSVVDEAFDDGDALVFRKGSATYNVPFSEIQEVGHPFANFKNLITVKLRSAIGSRTGFTFRAGAESSTFRAPPIFDELDRRIARAKQR